MAAVPELLANVKALVCVMVPLATTLTLVPALIAVWISVALILVTAALTKSPAKDAVVLVVAIVTLVGSSNHSLALTVLPSVFSTSPDVSTLLALSEVLVTLAFLAKLPAPKLSLPMATLPWVALIVELSIAMLLAA